MSADVVIIYYGLKFPVTEEEVKELQEEEHPYQVTARKLDLNCYWGDCSAVEDEYYVFVGKEIGRMGCEHPWNQEISDPDLSRIIETTKATLKNAGFTEEPKLLMHLQPDF